MRVLRIAAPAQLRLGLGNENIADRWEELPEPTRVSALGLLARLIARGVVDEEEGDRGDE